MLKLNINNPKPLTFEIQLSGINPDMLSGYLRFEIEEVEYGFPVEFGSESISVEIPPLSGVVNTELKEGDILTGKLEVNGNGHFLTPWEGEFTVANPVKMEAKVYEKDDNEIVSEAPQISVNTVVAEKKNKYTKEKLVESKPQKSTNKKKVVKEVKKVIPEKAKPKVNLNNITEKDIYKFMTYMGTKSEPIQKIIYEQCEIKAASDEPKKIFKEVYKVLNKKNNEN